MGEKKYDEACPKLEEVVRLVPEDLGGGTKIEMIKGGALYLRETRCEGAVLFEGWK